MRRLKTTQAAVEQLERVVGAEQLFGDRDAVHKFQSLETVRLASVLGDGGGVYLEPYTHEARA